jgi:Fur family ferric uptake transcriptional regulator
MTAGSPRADPAARTDAEVEQWRSLGRAPTRGRVLVLRALAGRDRAVSAQELHRDLREAGTPVGLNAIYIALHALADAGQLHAITLNGETHYRQCASTTHEHVVCVRCARVWEVDPGPVSAWLTFAAGGTGRIVGHRAEVLVVCADCDRIDLPPVRHNATYS